MENKIDQFFKDKLEGHSSTPSEESWAKVEANLSKKNNVAVWRIAAAILITGALISVIIWSQRGIKNNEQILAAKKSPKDHSIKEKSASQASPIEKKEVAKSFQKKSSKTLPRSVSPQTENKSDQKKGEEIEMLSVKTQTTVEETTLAEKSKLSPAIASESKLEEIKKQEATPPTTIASTRQKPIKLEFTLEDYSSEQPVATVNAEKSSGFKKVWNLAREVKNGDGPVREIKNEIFAHNFRKNKNQ